DARANLPRELCVPPQPGLSRQTLKAARAAPPHAMPGGRNRVKVPPGQERVRAQALLRAGAQYVQPN
ncbi:MAG: serine protease, partial [Thermus sp.]|nr:serine protease [Thermus sp.]